MDELGKKITRNHTLNYLMILINYLFLFTKIYNFDFIKEQSLLFINGKRFD